MVRRYWLGSASALATLFACCAPALAQEIPTTQTNEEEEIVVTGVRASLVQGLENKRNATQVIESVVAEDIGKLPDNNVIEALQRVTGVQVTNRGGGEADGITIRGLPDATTTWNGRHIFTGTGRQLALQDIPANLVSRIDVYKTRSADQIETGLAGQVDVFTRRPLDFDGLQFSLNARSIHQEQRDTYDPSVSFLVSNRWETGAGEFGALVNVSYTKTRWRDQSITAGALVPFAAADSPPLGAGPALDVCDGIPNGERNTPPANPNWIPLERIFNSDCRAPGPNPDGLPPGSEPLQLLWQAGLDRGLSTAPGSTLSINGADYEYLLARDALFASDFQGDRERPAVNVALQWAPNSSSTYTFEAFYQGYREDLFNNLHFVFVDNAGALGVDPASTITLYPGTNLIKTRTIGSPFGFNSGDSTVQSTDTMVYALNGQWEIGDRLDLAADLSYQESEFQTEFMAVRTTQLPQAVRLDFNSGDGLPSWEFGSIAPGGDIGNPADFINGDATQVDPATWTVAELFQNAGRQEGDAVTFTADGDYDLAAGTDSFFQKLSFGVRYDVRGATQFSPRPSSVPFLGQSLSALPAAYRWTNENFFDGRANVPSSWLVFNGYYIQDHQAEIRSLYGQPAGDLPLIPAFDVEETTTAAYVMGDLQLGRLWGQIGVRYVNVETEMTFTDLISPDLEQTSADQQVDKYLPAVTLRYDVTDDLRLRFNYGETLRRPTFGDLNPNFNLVGDLTQVGRGSGSGGNPDLAPTESKNTDIGVEWYFAEDSALYATLFRREIEGLVVPITRAITIPNSGVEPRPPTDIFVVTQPVNASDGVLEGVEIGFIYFPDYLPGVLDGLGVQASFTKLDSSQNIPLTNSEGEIVGQENTSFFVVSNTSYNVTLAYDRDALGMRLSYVWRDDFLNNNEARLFANPIGIWRLPEKSLDFGLTYALNERLAFSFDATNLTDELQQSYYAFADAGGPDTHNFGSTLISRTFALGLRYSLN